MTIKDVDLNELESFKIRVLELRRLGCSYDDIQWELKCDRNKISEVIKEAKKIREKQAMEYSVIINRKYTKMSEIEKMDLLRECIKNDKRIRE